MPHIPPVYMEREDTLMSSSSLRLSCGAFRGVRDSLFLASNGGQDGEAEIDDDDDDGAAFLRRRRDGGTKLIGLANDSSLLMLQTATDSESRLPLAFIWCLSVMRVWSTRPTSPTFPL